MTDIFFLKKTYASIRCFCILRTDKRPIESQCSQFPINCYNRRMTLPEPMLVMLVKKFIIIIQPIIMGKRIRSTVGLL